MKKAINILSIVLLLAVFSSCKKDDVAPVIPNVSNAYWETTSFKEVISNSGISATFMNLKTKTELEDYGMYQYLLFAEGGNVYMSETAKPTATSTVYAKWVQNGDKVTISVLEVNGAIGYDILATVSGNSMTVVKTFDTQAIAHTTTLTYTLR